MNISKPTAFRHNVHAALDPKTGDVLCRSFETSDGKEMNISGPTHFKHNIHGTVDPITGKIVSWKPDVQQTDDKDYDESYDCNNCNELYYQWQKDQVKIKQLQEENHLMLAITERLWLFANKINNKEPFEQNFSFYSHSQESLADFENNMSYIASLFIRMRNEHESTVQEMKAEINQINKQLWISQNIHQTEILEAQEKFKAAKDEFNFRVFKAEEELQLLKDLITEQQDENENLRRQLRNVKVLLTGWNTAGQRATAAFNQEKSLVELKKENESLKKDLKQLETDKKRLAAEVETTMYKLLQTADHSSASRENRYPCNPTEQELRTTAECSKTQTAGKQIYNITAKAVNIIEKSNVKYHKGEIRDSVEETTI